MHWGVNDNLDIIMTEGAGFSLNYACELDRIEGGNIKTFKK